MLASLQRTRSVLQRVGPDVRDMGVPFSQLPEAGATVRSHAVFMDLDCWVDMGEPDTITVTIDPGDQLND